MVAAKEFDGGAGIFGTAVGLRTGGQLPDLIAAARREHGLAPPSMPLLTTREASTLPGNNAPARSTPTWTARPKPACCWH